MTDRVSARRGELVDAAYKVFSTEGYRTTGVADIVRTAGVSHGTFYNYFDSKRHILDAVLEHAVALIASEVIGEEQPREATTFEELSAQFGAILHRLFAVIEFRPGLVEFLVFDAPAIDDELIRRLLELSSSFSTITTAYLENAVRRGFLAADLDTRIAGEVLLALMFSAVISAVGGPLTEDEKLRQITAIVDFAFNGVAP